MKFVVKTSRFSLLFFFVRAIFSTAAKMFHFLGGSRARVILVPHWVGGQLSKRSQEDKKKNIWFAGKNGIKKGSQDTQKVPPEKGKKILRLSGSRPFDLTFKVIFYAPRQSLSTLFFCSYLHFSVGPFCSEEEEKILCSFSQKDFFFDLVRPFLL